MVKVDIAVRIINSQTRPGYYTLPADYLPLVCNLLGKSVEPNVFARNFYASLNSDKEHKVESFEVKSREVFAEVLQKIKEESGKRSTIFDFEAATQRYVMDDESGLVHRQTANSTPRV